MKWSMTFPSIKGDISVNVEADAYDEKTNKQLAAIFAGIIRQGMTLRGFDDDDVRLMTTTTEIP